MYKCWQEKPHDRPTCDQISEFLDKLLSKEITPAAGSDEAAGYFYERSTTKHIPGDYLDVEIVVGDDDYIKVLPFTAAKNIEPVTNHYSAAPEGVYVEGAFSD